MPYRKQTFREDRARGRGHDRRHRAHLWLQGLWAAGLPSCRPGEMLPVCALAAACIRPKLKALLIFPLSVLAVRQ